MNKCWVICVQVPGMGWLGDPKLEWFGFESKHDLDSFINDLEEKYGSAIHYVVSKEPVKIKEKVKK